MNFENENAETFGLGKLSELTMKNNLDLLSCVECGRCTQVCPANLAGKILDPKKSSQKPATWLLKLKQKVNLMLKSGARNHSLLQMNLMLARPVEHAWKNVQPILNMLI